MAFVGALSTGSYFRRPTPSRINQTRSAVSLHQKRTQVRMVAYGSSVPFNLARDPLARRSSLPPSYASSGKKKRFGKGSNSGPKRGEYSSDEVDDEDYGVVDYNNQFGDSTLDVEAVPGSANGSGSVEQSMFGRKLSRARERMIIPPNAFSQVDMGTDAEFERNLRRGVSKNLPIPTSKSVKSRKLVSRDEGLNDDEEGDEAEEEDEQDGDTVSDEDEFGSSLSASDGFSETEQDASPPNLIDIDEIDMPKEAMDVGIMNVLLSGLSIRTLDTNFFQDRDPMISQKLEEFWREKVSQNMKGSRILPASSMPAAPKVPQKPATADPDSLDSEDVSDLPWMDTYALAVETSRFEPLRNLYSRVGILIQSNYDDFEPNPNFESDDEYEDDVQDGAALSLSLEDWSRWKAYCVYHATGLPCIASTSDFEIPPQPGVKNDRGFYTRNMNPDVIEKACQRLAPISPPDRQTRFESVAVYYDGENDIVGTGLCECDLEFCTPNRNLIALTSALDNIYKELYQQFSFDLAYFENIGRAHDQSDMEKKNLMGAALLRDRILNEGKVLKDNILKVSSFLNHKVDAALMEVCGEELAYRLRHTRPNKILTVEATGLIPALSVARNLRLPLVFARKSRPTTISDSYQTTYRSSTKGTTSELIVSEEYLGPSDRVIIIDDFLAGGSTIEALFKIAKMAGARVVGVGVLIEKVPEGGRTFLAGMEVPVESLAKVTKIEQGRIEIAKEKTISYD